MATRHLLVDGWNVIHAVPELRRALRSGGASGACVALVAMLRPAVNAEGWRATVVLDARAGALNVEQAIGGVTVVLAPANRTADSVIEALVTAAAKGSCVVVTEDRAELELVSAAGAETMRPGDLSEWLKRMEEQTSRRVRSMGGGSLGNLGDLLDIKINK
jgi:predicted RNA-binding protein with PIN domain